MLLLIALGLVIESTVVILDILIDVLRAIFGA